MNHLLNVLDGFASAFAWGPSKSAYHSTRGGFRRDQEKLRADVRKVGRDLENNLRQHGEPISEGRGKKR